MAAACRGFQAVAGRTGVAIGILPQGPPRGYPNSWVDVVIQTHLPDRGAEGASERSRNHLNVLSSHAIVALPGGAGTRTEVELARRYGRPLIAFLGADGEIEGLTREQLPALAMELAEVAVFIRRHVPRSP
jgi:predicted Rossmann-fold nucleotide-binding protein